MWCKMILIYHDITHGLQNAAARENTMFSCQTRYFPGIMGKLDVFGSNRLFIEVSKLKVYTYIYTSFYSYQEDDGVWKTLRNRGCVRLDI